MSAAIRDEFAAVLAEHACCIVNAGSDNSGSGQTGVDVWSCGIRVPFLDDLEDAERAHVAAAILASPTLARYVAGAEQRGVANEARVEAWDEGHEACRVAFHRLSCRNPYRPFVFKAVAQ